MNSTMGPLLRIREWFRLQISDRPFITNVRLRIFLVSFTLLFYELLCIRWIPSYVRYLSYFTNFILMASFLGMGLGILSARRKGFWFPPFSVMVLLLVYIVSRNKFELHIASTSVLYYGASEIQSARSESFLILPEFFALVTLSFIPLARQLGRLLTQTQPLTAYTYDIIGSLAGIASFFAIAYFSLPPAVWFVILAVLVTLLSGRRLFAATLVPLVASLVIVLQLQQNTYWSPYYRIVLTPAKPSGYLVDVNNTGHQSMVPWQQKEPFYLRPYEIFPDHTFKRALIIGAGTGSDTSIALAHGVSDITAVEIDPKIQQLGAQLHPDQPYSDPRVKVVINDGRTFLQNTKEKYDLIIFALPDSLTLTSSMTSLRLESFLLTQESIEAGRHALSDDGLLVLYNYYREDWLVQKLSDMVASAFDQRPFVSTYGGWGRSAVIMAGPRLDTLPPGAFGDYTERESPQDVQQIRVIGEGFYTRTQAAIATDDWPFVYLRERTFPSIYLLALGLVGLASLGAVAAIAPRRMLRRFDWHMFFLGVAFSLLEVRALITFALLFGSTWMVNSLVFFAILCGVLLAVLVNARFKVRHIGVFYGLLFGMLVVNLIIRPETLLFQSSILRYVVASLLAFAPVFLANIIFSNSFRDTEVADVAFASNLLGIMVGGMLEYVSMLTGYHLLLVPVILFYACAMWLRRRSVAVAVPAVSET